MVQGKAGGEDKKSGSSEKSDLPESNIKRRQKQRRESEGIDPSMGPNPLKSPARACWAMRKRQHARCTAHEYFGE